jgi:RNA polymerase sigma factor (sigma-70 family)
VMDDAELVVAARSGDRDAFGPLVERWFDRCWEVSWRILHDRELAADVAQDTLLTAWQQLDRLEQPASFGGWVLRIARNRSLDRLTRERRVMATGDHDTLEPRQPTPDPDAPEAAHDRATQQDLVWAAAAALGERDMSLLDLHLRHGMEPHELAEELGIEPNAAHQAMFRLRKRLGAAIQAWLLWRGGDPDCVVLRAALATAGVESFGADLVRVVGRHVDQCGDCAEERARVTAPAAMFSVVPLVAPPAILRADAVRALAEQGVPVGNLAGSGSSGGDGLAGPGADPDVTTVIPTGGASSGGGSMADGLWGSDDTAEIPPVSPAGSVPVPYPNMGATGPPPPPSDPTAVLTAEGEDDNHRRAVALLVVGAVVLLLGVGLLWRWAVSPTPPMVVADQPLPTTSPTPGIEPTPTDVASPTESPTPTPEPTEAADPEPTESPTPTPSPTPSPTASPSPTLSPTPTEEPTEEPTETETPAPAPAIQEFSGGWLTMCPDGDGWFHEFTWTSEHADSATLATPDGTVLDVPASGAIQVCGPAPGDWTLTVIGPGGPASQTITTDSPPG